jgi:hypothetical protein
LQCPKNVTPWRGIRTYDPLYLNAFFQVQTAAQAAQKLGDISSDDEGVIDNQGSIFTKLRFGRKLFQSIFILKFGTNFNPKNYRHAFTVF